MIATSAIIPASGQGKRLGNDLSKAFVEIRGIPLVIRTLNVFQRCLDIADIVLVVQHDLIEYAEQLVGKYGISKVSKIVAGGDTRQDSVRNGISAISSDCEVVVIHDAARPFITSDIIRSSIDTALKYKAAIAAVPVIDTIKQSADGIHIDTTLDRNKLFAVQTPQTFLFNTIKDAHESAYVDGFIGTDDGSLVERMGESVSLIQGSYDNIKITTPADIFLAESILDKQNNSSGVSMNIRIGHGYDIHCFSAGRRLVLGGVEFHEDYGLLGHSDADVLIHAVADAMLGAAGAGDIGKHFPDTDPAYKDANSLRLLEHVAKYIDDMGWKTGNIDVTLIAQKPKISKFTEEMKQNIGITVGIDPICVNIKATTAEGLGDIGRELGIECHAVAILHSK